MEKTYRINKNILRALRFPIILTALSYLLGFILYPKLPYFVPTAWDLEGRIIAYAPKNIAVTFLPTIAFVILLIFVLLPYLDPLKRNYRRFVDTYMTIANMFVVITCLLDFLMLFVIVTKWNGLVPKAALISNCVVYIVVGNYFPRIKQNWFVGVGTPYTYKSEKIWRKTQNFAGVLLFSLGIFYLPFVFFRIPDFLSSTSFASLILIASMLYSLVLFVKYRKEDTEISLKGTKEISQSIVFTLSHFLWWAFMFLILFRL